MPTLRFCCIGCKGMFPRETSKQNHCEACAEKLVDENFPGVREHAGTHPKENGDLPPSGVNPDRVVIPTGGLVDSEHGTDNPADLSEPDRGGSSEPVSDPGLPDEQGNDLSEHDGG